MTWNKIGTTHWRYGHYEITKPGKQYCLWRMGQLICTDTDFERLSGFIDVNLTGIEL